MAERAAKILQALSESADRQTSDGAVTALRTATKSKNFMVKLRAENILRRLPQRAATKLKNLGAYVSFDDNGTRISIDEKWESGDEGLIHLARLQNVRSVNLHNKHISDAGLTHLKDLNDLEHLSFLRMQISDAGLKHLKGLTNLKSLGLCSTQITSQGMAYLQGMKRLESLQFNNSQRITDSGLVNLKGLSKLHGLDLSKTKIGNAGLVHLKNLSKNLRTLNLGNTKVGDDSLLQMSLTRLQQLHLHSTLITDKGLTCLDNVSDDFDYCLLTRICG